MLVVTNSDEVAFAMSFVMPTSQVWNTGPAECAGMKIDQRSAKLIDQFLYTADWNEKVRIQDGSIATVFTLSAESATPQVLFPLLESLPTMPPNDHHIHYLT